MSKIYSYMVLAVGLTLLLKFAGIPSGGDAFLSWLGISDSASGISMGTFFVAVVALFAGGTLIGISISYLTKSSSESYIIAPVALGIFTVITSTFVSLINYTSDMEYVSYIVAMIFLPLLGGFGIAIIQFWRGTE